jgi:hypothetical protein
MELSLRQLEEAVSVRREIDRLTQRLDSILRGGTDGARPNGNRAVRTMSPQVRAKIAASARARWAARKGSKSSRAAAKTSSRKSGGISAAGRRKLSRMMKARWAARRKAAGKK